LKILIARLGEKVDNLKEDTRGSGLEGSRAAQLWNRNENIERVIRGTPAEFKEILDRPNDRSA